MDERNFDKNWGSRQVSCLRCSVIAKHFVLVFTINVRFGKEIRINYICAVHSTPCHDIFWRYWYPLEQLRGSLGPDACIMRVHNSIDMGNARIWEKFIPGSESHCSIHNRNHVHSQGEDYNLPGGVCAEKHFLRKICSSYRKRLLVVEKGISSLTLPAYRDKLGFPWSNLLIAATSSLAFRGRPDMGLRAALQRSRDSWNQPLRKSPDGAGDL